MHEIKCERIKTNINYYHEAVNKKKSVSCPAGGRNCGQSGGRNFFFFHVFFCLVGKYCPLLGKKKRKIEKLKKKVSSRPFFRHPAGPPETEFFFRLA